MKDVLEASQWLSATYNEEYTPIIQLKTESIVQECCQLTHQPLSTALLGAPASLCQVVSNG